MRALLFLAVVLAIAVPVAADHCATWSTHAAEVDTKMASEMLGTERYYLADDCFPVIACPMKSPLFSLWLYEETNGLEGLQRGDEMVDDTCHNVIEADTIIL